MRVIKPNNSTVVDGSFSRATVANYYDENGLLKSAAINELRFDYDPENLLYKGAVLEEARTNMFSHSENFSNAVWDETNCTMNAAASELNPRGVTGGVSRVIEGSSALGAVSKYFFQSFTAESGSTYTMSLYVKERLPSQKRLFGFTLYTTQIGGSGSSAVRIDIATGAISGPLNAALGVKYQKLQNDWCRISITYTSVTNSFITPLFRFYDADGSTDYVGDGSASFFIWGAQNETHTVGNTIRASSYIGTTTAAVTRAADVVTGTGLIFTNVTDPNPLWSSATTYALGAKVRYLGYVYESLQASNLNKIPSSQPTWWLRLYADNIHAALDNVISTESTAIQEMTFVVKPGSINALALLNVDAEVISVCVTDPADGNVYYATYGLTGVTVYDWFQYFFYDTVLKRTQVVLEDIPQYANALITIKISGAVGATVSIAQALFGNSSDLGLTQYGVNAGIIDYSKKETDEFGTVTFVQRPFSKRMSAEVFINNSELNRVQNFLYSIRATPSVWIASNDPLFEETLVVFGFYRDFSTTIAYPSHSICNLEIEGLT